MRHPAAVRLCPLVARHVAAPLALVLLSSLSYAASSKPSAPPLQHPTVPDFSKIKPPPYKSFGRPSPSTSPVVLAPTDLSKLIPAISQSPHSSDDPVAATETGVEFAGFLRNGQEHRFVLTEPARGSSEWLTLGQTYAGLTLVDFDATREVLAVRTGARTLRLALKDGRPRPAPNARETQIVVDARGQLFIAGEKMPSTDLRSRLENLAENLPNLAFNLVVYWPRNADSGLVERLGNHIAETVRTLPPELRKRYPSLAWKTLER